MFYKSMCFTCKDITRHVVETQSCTKCAPKHNTNLYNFVIFKNYDGTVTGHSIPRDVWNKLFGDA